MHGLPVDLVLATSAGLVGGDRHTLVTAGEVLATMPGLGAAHRDGRVPWGFVRHVVRLVRRRSRADRALLDARIVATLDAQAGAGVVDPDALVEAIDAAAAELAGRRSAEDRERRAVAGNRLWAQLGWDGRVAGGFDYDSASAAVVLNALAAAQGRPAADEDDRPLEVPTPQERGAAAALVAVCRAFLGGGDGRRARPAYVVGLDADRMDTSEPGRLRLRLRGPAPRVPGRRVAADAVAGADVRVVVTRNGAPCAVTRPAATDSVDDAELAEARETVAALGVPRGAREGLARLVAAVTRALSACSDVERVLAGGRPLGDAGLCDAQDVPTATRIAVVARDGGCRMPGCTAPVDWCDVHHLVHREDGGDHHPDNLALFCRGDHTVVHAGGWTLTLDPATGMLTARRGTQVWATLPRGHPLARPPTGADPPARPPPPPSGRDPVREGDSGPAEAGPDTQPDLPF